ncbi:PREDICTED: uncharacterized protein LOC109467656 [Branchiostoma belcheri]|uniref:Uncharacterized protein LOC109467656 n=1 Tax=Branchiostoma belcheri TaxID=7741 RepID=A0A6P4YRE3_BRABE|nr:PREDICTED: uncharacterized protein LOC109467656 [Branchiostoma belcheri]
MAKSAVCTAPWMSGVVVLVLFVTMVDPTEHQQSEHGTAQQVFQFEVNQVLDRQFTQLTQALETAETSRVKRTVDFTLSPMFPHETEDQAEEVHLSGVSMTDVYTMAFLQLDDVAFLFLASGNSQVHNVTIFALDADSEDFSKAGEWQVSGPVVLEAISMGSSGFLLVSEEDEKNVPKAYRTEIYTFNRGATSFVQTIVTPGSCHWRHFTMEDGLFIAMLSERAYSGSMLLHIYYWDGAYFDKVYDIPVQTACDIEPFTIQKQSYLAVANCPTDSAKGTERNSSLIYKFLPFKNEFEVYQMLPGYVTTDLEFFTAGPDAFLAVTQRTAWTSTLQHTDTYNCECVIYRWNGYFFVPYQDIPLTDADVTKSVQLYQEQAVLLVTNAKDSVETYQLANDKFEQSSIFSSHSDLIGVKDIHSFYAGTSSYLMFISDEARLFKLTFLQRRNLMGFQHVTVGEGVWLSAELQNVEKSISKLSSDIQMKEVKLNMSELVEGRKSFQNITISHWLTEWDDTIVTEEEKQAVQEYEDLMASILLMYSTSMDIMDSLPRYLSKSGEQTFTTDKHIKSLKVKHLSTSKNIDAEIINKEKFRHLVKNMFYNNQADQSVHATLTLPFLTVQGNVTVLGTIDDLHIPLDVVFQHIPNDISATKAFEQGVVFHQDMDVSGSIDDMLLEDCLLTQEDQNVTGFLTFGDDISCKGEVIVEEELTVSTVDLSSLAGAVVYLQVGGAPVRLAGSCVITTTVDVQGDVSITGTIDQVDICQLGETVMRVDSSQIISADWTVLSDVTFTKDLTVAGTINNVFLPGDVARWEGDHIMTGDVFLNNRVVITSTGVLVLGGTADGILLSNILTVESDQEINGQIMFQTNIVLRNSSIVSGLINGIELPWFAADILWKSVENLMTDLQSGVMIITGVKTFADFLVCQPPCSVDGFVDGVDVTHLYHNTVGPHQPDNVPENVLLVSQSYMSAHLSSDSRSFWTDFTFADVPANLKSNLYFLGNVSISDHLSVEGLVNGADVNAILTDALVTTGPQVVVGSKVFVDGVTLTELHVDGTVDGLNLPDDVMTIQATQYSSGVQTFQDEVHLSKLAAGQLTVHELSDWNLTDLMMNTLFTHAHQSVLGKKTFAGSLDIVADLMVVGEVDEVMQLQNVTSDAVKKDGSVTVATKQVFMEVSIWNISVTGLLSGVDMSYLSPGRVMVQHMNQTIHGHRTLLQNVSMTCLTVQGLLNGADVLQLEQEAMLVTDTCYTGVMFKDVISEGNISLHEGGQTDGLDLSLDLDGKIIYGQKTFLMPVHVHGNIRSQNGRIDQVNLTQVADQTMDTKSSQVITAAKTIHGNVHLTGDMIIQGFLNGILVNEFQHGAMTLTRDHIISDHKRFQDVIITQLSVSGTTTGVHLEDVNSQRVTLNKTTHIMGRKLLMASTGLKNHLTTSEIVLSGLLTGLDVPIFSSAVLRRSSTQVITGLHTWQCVVQTQSLQLGGALNSVVLHNVWLTSQSTSTIQEKTFRFPLRIIGDIELGPDETVNGVDISEWERLSVLTDGRRQVHGSVRMGSVHVTAGLRVTGHIDGVEVSRMMRVHGDQVITGRKTFIGNVVISKQSDILLHGLFNKLDMKTLMQGALKHESTSFLILTHVYGNVSVHGRVGFSLSVGRYDPEGLREGSRQLVQMYTDVSQYLPHHRTHTCQAVNTLNTFLSAFRLPVQYFEMQVLFDEDSISVHGFGHQLQQYVMVCSCQAVTVYMMTSSADQPLIPVYSSTFSPTVHITSYSFTNRTFIVTTHDKTNWYPTVCTTIPDDSLYAYSTIYEWSGEHLVPVQTILRPPGRWGRGISVEPFWDGTYQYILITGEAGNEALVYRSTALRYGLINGLKLQGLHQLTTVQYRGKIFATVSKSSAPDASAPFTADIYSWRSRIQRFTLIGRIPEHGVVESRLFAAEDSLYVVLLTQQTSQAHGTRSLLSVYQYGVRNRFLRQQQDSLPSTAKDIQVITAAGVTYLCVTVEGVKLMLYTWKGDSGFVFDLSVNVPGLMSAEMFTDRRRTRVYAVVRTDKTVETKPIITNVRQSTGHISTAVLWSILPGVPVREPASICQPSEKTGNQETA